MTGRRRRGLSPEEQALWNRVAEQAAPLHPPRRHSDPVRDIAQPKAPPKPATRIDPFEIGQARTETALPHDLAPSHGEWPNRQPVRMDRKAHTRMKRGKLQPEARIDLHGMTMDRAHGVLTGFILRAHREDKRLVLVITGKGRDHTQCDD